MDWSGKLSLHICKDSKPGNRNCRSVAVRNKRVYSRRCAQTTQKTELPGVNQPGRRGAWTYGCTNVQTSVTLRSMRCRSPCWAVRGQRQVYSSSRSLPQEQKSCIAVGHDPGEGTQAICCSRNDESTDQGQWRPGRMMLELFTAEASDDGETAGE